MTVYGILFASSIAHLPTFVLQVSIWLVSSGGYLAYHDYTFHYVIEGRLRQNIQQPSGVSLLPILRPTRKTQLTIPVRWSQSS